MVVLLLFRPERFMDYTPPSRSFALLWILLTCTHAFMNTHTDVWDVTLFNGHTAGLHQLLYCFHMHAWVCVCVFVCVCVLAVLQLPQGRNSGKWVDQDRKETYGRLIRVTTLTYAHICIENVHIHTANVQNFNVYPHTQSWQYAHVQIFTPSHIWVATCVCGCLCAVN